MQPQKTERLVKISFLILVFFILCGLAGLAIWPLKVTSFWAVGLGVLSALFFITSLSIHKYGLGKALLSMLIILVATTLTFVLNNFRGWPFGFVTYHDVLGWKILGICWPIPLYWTFFTMSSLILTRPVKAEVNDPKMPFSWAFDTAIMVMVLALVIEPIITASSIETWAVTGSYFGIPFFSFVGWFVMAFVSGFATILITKLWERPAEKPPLPLLVTLLGMGLLGMAASIRLGMVLVGLICLIISAYLAYRINKDRGSLKYLLGKKDEAPVASDDKTTDEQPLS